MSLRKEPENEWLALSSEVLGSNEAVVNEAVATLGERSGVLLRYARQGMREWLALKPEGDTTE